MPRKTKDASKTSIKGRPRKPQIPSWASKQIRELAKLSLYPEEQVFADALKAGLTELKEPYSAIASFRATLEDDVEPKDEDVQSIPGETEPFGDFSEYEPPSDAPRETEVESGFEPSYVLPGHLAESEPVAVCSDGRANGEES